MLQKQRIQIKKIFIVSTIFVACLHLGIRSLMSRRVINFLVRGESTESYLNNYLSGSLGNFGRVGDFLRKQVNSQERVLILGGHNFFYFPVNFDHESWAQPGIKYKYLVTENRDLPAVLSNLPIAFVDSKTKTVVYVFDQTWESK
ncbi:hypothetical protein A2160_03900 [Candidatus Beckwithbacteria bacterium RBG_13_42_9]|uniref:Uncharacterized protein n=1 Tax=Candidatus Beckwithbacteria bacterium RBG_13_42_9 TaxID=1797457 RepID=A0A1F5E5Z5_9BACT|nr:MAG: hypothetical protein A2160_03900 [Candidatus Beckwithbacteria bacterium RBG_13_42_9]